MSNTLEIRTRRAPQILATLLASLPVGATLAQEPETGDSKNTGLVEEVLVTAMRREQSLMDIPQSVQVFQGEELEFQGVGDLNKTLEMVPGANVGYITTPGTVEYNFRGTGAQGNFGDMAVGFYIDDVPFYQPDNPFGPAIRFFDLESVQVLRGPQGTLYGQGSMGGTIIVTTSKPNLSETELRARVRGADLKDGESSYAVDVSASIPLIDDALALRITAGYAETPGLAESPDFPGEEDIDDGELQDVRVKLLYSPNETFSAHATYWLSTGEGNFNNNYFENDPPTIVSGGIEADRENEIKLSSLVLSWDSPLGLVKSSTSYNDGFDDALIGQGTFLGPETPGLITIVLAAESTSFNQEITLTSAPGDIEWIIGASYTDADRETDFSLDVSLIEPPISVFGVATVTRTETEQVALFGEISASFMDGLLTPLFGLRGYRDDRKFTDNAIDGSNSSEYDEDFSTLSPRLNLRIQPSEDTAIYLNAAKGFRSGNFNPQGFIDTAALFGVSAEAANPESTLWSYEVGARLQLLGGSLVVEPAAYYIDFTDYQFASVVGGAASVSLALDDVTSIGADIAIQWSTPIEGFVLGLTANWNETTAENVDPEILSSVLNLEEGEQMPYIPEWGYSLNASYIWQFNNGFSGSANLSVAGLDGMQGTEAAISEDTSEVALRLGVNKDNWGITLFGTNLLDERRPQAIRGPTTQTRRDTREIGVELTYRFL